MVGSTFLGIRGALPDAASHGSTARVGSARWASRHLMRGAAERHRRRVRGYADTFSRSVRRSQCQLDRPTAPESASRLGRSAGSPLKEPNFYLRTAPNASQLVWASPGLFSQTYVGEAGNCNRVREQPKLRDLEADGFELDTGGVNPNGT
jgi:hypothetical protein